MDETVNVMIVDDHDVLSQALAVALRNVGIDVTVAADLEREALPAEIRVVGPDVVLLDLHLGVYGTSHEIVAELVSLAVRSSCSPRRRIATRSPRRSERVRPPTSTSPNRSTNW